MEVAPRRLQPGRHPQQPGRAAHHARRLGRRIALGKSSHRELLALQAELDALLAQDHGTSEAVAELQRRIDALTARIGKIPYLDPIDLRFRARTPVPVPSSQAVDVLRDGCAGSMDETRKDLAASSSCCTCFSRGTTRRSTSCSSATTPRRPR